MNFMHRDEEINYFQDTTLLVMLRCTLFLLIDFPDKQWNETYLHYHKVEPKQTYYLSMEFPQVWALTNAIGNLDIQDASALNKLGHELEEITEQANRGFGLTAHIVDHCKLILKFPEGTNSIWGVPIIKCKKMSLGVLKLLVLACAIVCCVYACSTYLEHTHIDKKRELFEFQVIGRPRRNNVFQSHNAYLHYPKPKAPNRFECTRNLMRSFVIMSMQRSGSGWFETLLNSHANVSSNGEIFGQRNRRGNVSSIINTLDRVYNLDLLTSSSKNECSAIGFKWMLNQGLMEYPKEILDYFAKRGVTVIFFLRRNMLRRLVSILANSFDKDAKLLNEIHVSHVHSHEEALTLSKYKSTINITSLELDLEEMESTAIKALEYFNSTRHIIVYYEDLIKNPYKLIQVEDFLKLPRMKLHSQQVKIHKGPLSELINIWDDVNKALRGTT